MSQETTTSPTQPTMRTRLALSTTTRGWDYESTVEVIGPVPMTIEERAALLDAINRTQLDLRISGETERDLRNARDGKGGGK